MFLWLAHMKNKKAISTLQSIFLVNPLPPRLPCPMTASEIVNVSWDHHEPTSNAKSQAELLQHRGRQTPVLGCEGQEGSLVLPGCQGTCKSPVVECTASPRPWRRLSSPSHVLSATALLPHELVTSPPWPWGWTQSLRKLPVAWYR